VFSPFGQSPEPPPHPRLHDVTAPTASSLPSRFRTLASTALGVGALIAAVALLAVPEATGSAAPPRVEARSVAVAEVVAADHVRTLRFSGVVRAERRAELAFVLSGRVDARLVELGQHVEAGDTLARLDRRALLRAVDAAEASVVRADADLAHGRLEEDRVRKLSDLQAIAAADADDASHATSVAAAARRQAKAQAGLARRDLSETTLRAPFSGTVARIDVEPGEFTTAGRTVVEIVGDDTLEVEVALPESLLATVSEGQELDVELPLVDRVVRGRVRSIGASAPETAGLFPVIVELDATTGLRSGMTARIVVTAPLASGIAVPVEAIVDRTGTAPKLLSVRGGKVQVHDVDVLAIAGREAVVAAAMSPGDEVITRGQAGLSTGDEVLVQRVQR
jgi:RND family efflux transporter MFP subunit